MKNHLYFRNIVTDNLNTSQALGVRNPPPLALSARPRYFNPVLIAPSFPSPFRLTLILTNALDEGGTGRHHRRALGELRAPFHLFNTHGAR